MLQTDIIKAIDADIGKHHSKASEMLNTVQSILMLGLVVLLIYFAPGVAERQLPMLEEAAKTEVAAYEMAITKFKAKYKADYVFVSQEAYEQHKKNGTATEQIESARDISRMENGNGAALTAARLISKLRVEDSKIEFVLKLLPYVIGVVLAGFLVTYRLHVMSAKELTLKKFDILARSAGAQDGENDVPVAQ